jgi:hypothetical protein
MRRVVWVAVVALIGSTSSAQPPAALSPTVIPTAAATPVSPFARFSDFAKYPPETLSLVDSYRSAAIWLGKMHQAHGKFLPGLDPALAQKTEADSDAVQAVACLALCQSARLVPDPATTAKANQAVLALFATNAARDKASPAERVRYAAALSLAVRELPGADAKLVVGAEQLVEYLKTCAAENGTFPDALAVQAIAVSAAVASAEWKTNLLVKAATGYRAALKTKPNAADAATVMAGLFDGCVATKDQTLAAVAFELADAVVAAQYGPADAAAPPRWVGGFRGPAEPGYEAAVVARGLAVAARFTRRYTSDTTRYGQYRQATLNALAFVQTLQYTDENTSHFEARFRTQFLLGGVRSGVTNPVLRADATGWAALACAAFLESGAEGRE